MRDATLYTLFFNITKKRSDFKAFLSFLQQPTRTHFPRFSDTNRTLDTNQSGLSLYMSFRWKIFDCRHIIESANVKVVRRGIAFVTSVWRPRSKFVHVINLTVRIIR